MKHRMVILAAVAALAHAGAALAQTATDTATTPTTSHAGAYDALSEGNRKIVSAIYEAQLGSPKDASAGTLLTRDEIAAMRQKTGWGNVYRQLHEQGLVTEKNLGQAVSSYNHSVKAGSNVTVISTAGGDQIAIQKDKRGSTAAPVGKAGTAAKANNAAAKAVPAKSTVVTTAGGNAATASAAAQSSAGGGNGNGLASAAKAK